MEIKLDHLLPAARDMALLSAEQRVTKLQSDYWIGYSRAEQRPALGAQGLGHLVDG